MTRGCELLPNYDNNMPPATTMLDLRLLLPMLASIGSPSWRWTSLKSLHTSEQLRQPGLISQL